MIRTRRYVDLSLGLQMSARSKVSANAALVTAYVNSGSLVLEAQLSAGWETSSSKVSVNLGSASRELNPRLRRLAALWGEPTESYNQGANMNDIEALVGSSENVEWQKTKAMRSARLLV